MMMMPIPIPIHGSVDDAHTILGVGEDYFTRDFKEYMRNERLNWSRLDLDPPTRVPAIGWVFWSQLDNSADLIRQAIQKLIYKESLLYCLVQFWAPTKTSEGRTLLTTQFQPFALGMTPHTKDAHKLCEYRMGMCRKSFYADAECAQELLGLPGRVFLNQLPESTPHVYYYTLKEYPQRDLALRCGIDSSRAEPVFEHSTHTCVGVLEIVSLEFMSPSWLDKSFLGQMYDIFQEVGLQCFDGYKHSELQIGDENKAGAFQELKTVLETVCKIHKLPLAMTWVPCSDCNYLLRGKPEGVEFFTHWDTFQASFINVSKCSHLTTGVVAGMVHSSSNILYCSDITKLSLVEYPLVPYARCCKFRGWFTICLQSNYTANDIYVLEFFLPSSSNNSWTSILSLILGMMEENFKTFKLASGQELGDLLSVEVIDFHSGRKFQSVQNIQAKGGGVMLQLGQLDQASMDAIRGGTNVVSEDQNYISPSLEALQNGEVVMQLDSSHQPPLDPPNNGQNVVIADRNTIIVTSSEECKRETQKEHRGTGVKINVPLEDILKCAKMGRKGAAEKLQGKRNFKMMMPIHGSVDDVRTILGVRKNYFPPDFKEYIQKEQLNWWRFDEDPDWKGRPIFGWVFWSQLDNSADLIRRALQKLIGVLQNELHQCLVQFWAATKTSEGRTLLTTQFQPFALGTTYSTGARKRLCSYRMGMCREYNNSYADAECAEEQLGLPGRVFLNQLPESLPDVKHYTLKEYPQRELALRCEIRGSFALPVFEQISHICVGVLEIASTDNTSCWYDKKLIGRMDDIFQVFGLRCLDGYKHCKMQDSDLGVTTASRELKMVCESMCNIHNLPLALTWVPCDSCNDLLQSQFQFTVHRKAGSLEICDFMEVSIVNHLRKRKVTGGILPFSAMLYCSDVKQFSIAEFPLVPYARSCEFGGWFTMCLQSAYTRDESYVLEFFLPKSNENNENRLTKLRLILETMEEYFTTFKFASGQELGDVLSVEVIDFQNDQRSHSIQMIQAKSILCLGRMLQQVQLDQPSMDAINNGMHVVSETQNYNLPILDSLQNVKVTKQVDASDQQSMDPSNKGENAVTAERNILVVSSSKKGKRKTQDEEHKKAGVRIEVPLEEILKCSKMKREDAAKELKVSISTLKRVCRDFGINRWPPRNIEDPCSYQPLPVENLGQTPQLNYDLPSNQASASVAHIKPPIQGADMVTIIAICGKNNIKFRLSCSSRLVEIQQEVAKRLNLEAGTYGIKYTDENGLLILIACDEDLQYYLEACRSLGMSLIPIELELK